jgi:subtilisin family serine protease
MQNLAKNLTLFSLLTLGTGLSKAGSLAANPINSMQDAREACGKKGPENGRACSAIVIFRQGISSEERAKVIGISGAKFRFHLSRAHSVAVEVGDHGKWQRLAADPSVEAVIPDRLVFAISEADERTASMQGNTVLARGGPAKRSREISPQVISAGLVRIGASPGALPYLGTNIGVAIVDTGIDYNHPDLSPAASCFSIFSGGCQDANGHGTHVAGIVAALDNSIDVVGVAPKATIYGVRVLDAAGSGSDSTIMAGLEWVLANANSVIPPIRVVNMSLGRPGSLNDNPALRAVVQQVRTMGISVLVAAGNDQSTEVAGQVPATYPEVMAIASSSAKDGSNAGCRSYSASILQDTASYFTTDGAYNASTGIGVSISAPGEESENISKMCGLSSSGIISLKLGGGLVRMSGTSMASPHAAGAAALLLEQAGGSLDPELLRSKIMNSASRIGVAPLNSPTTSYTFDGVREGILSVCAALGVACL